MSKIEVNTITQQCGPSLTVGGGACKSVTLDATTVTLGRCGATVSLAAGATQTGFGRTGTVDWCTTAKTAPFTGVSGKGYFVNTTCAAVTVTLPATPTAGDIISIKDYARTAATNNINFCRNGSKMDGGCSSGLINTNGESTTLIYVDGTQGWTSILDSTTNNYGVAYVTATGGTITTCGDYKIHTFTADGCFAVSCAGNPAGSTTVDYLVIAGGGGGGGCMGAGGGAGGFREGYNPGSYTASPLATTALPVSATTYPITVGGGGGAGGPGSRGVSGSNSVFSTITSTGGGAGGVGGPNSPPAPDGLGDALTGGSGGGQRPAYVPNAYGPPGAAGNTPPTSPPQGNPGGRGYDGQSTITSAGGGGGSGAAGSDALAAGGPSGGGGNGGNGLTTSISGSPTAYAGGGGGGTDGPGAVDGSGGTGGGGSAGSPTGTAGTTNTGGGGGGGSAIGNSGGAGGSGVVIVRYKFQN
jgi:hypothetical protein